MRTPQPIDDYFFDLQGFLVLKGALSKQEVSDCNDTLDAIPKLQRNEWHGYVHRQDQPDSQGLNFQQIYESGPAFQKFIDHPNWIGMVNKYVGADGTFDAHHGPLFIDENFANIRGPGDAIDLHSGGDEGCIRTQFRYFGGKFHCGQINVLVALTDIGPGDGATMVIPGSHKSNLRHPFMDKKGQWGTTSVDGVQGAVEVHLSAGDAILFVDSIAHGSARRVNAGQRRISVFRYGPSWGNFRWGYQPSAELLARLSPSQRKMVQPQQGLRPPVAELV